MTVHDFLRRVCAGYVCLLFLFPVVILAFVSLATPTMMGGLVLPALLSVLAGNFAYHVMPRCPICGRNMFGSYWQRSNWLLETTLRQLAPTTCRSCGTDLTVLTYRQGLLGIPRPETIHADDECRK